jgi:hypothetical protein
MGERIRTVLLTDIVKRLNELPSARAERALRPPSGKPRGAVSDLRVQGKHSAEGDGADLVAQQSRDRWRAQELGADVGLADRLVGKPLRRCLQDSGKVSVEHASW